MKNTNLAIFPVRTFKLRTRVPAEALQEMDPVALLASDVSALLLAVGQMKIDDRRLLSEEGQKLVEQFDQQQDGFAEKLLSLDVMEVGSKTFHDGEKLILYVDLGAYLSYKEAISLTIGDPVRSFDFRSRELEGKHACYYEGVIAGIAKRNEETTVKTRIRGECIEEKPFLCTDCDRYIIRVTRQVWQGEMQLDHRKFIMPPVNGTRRLLGGFTRTVEPIG
jgi:hypothetical protein